MQSIVLLGPGSPRCSLVVYFPSPQISSLYMIHLSQLYGGVNSEVIADAHLTQHTIFLVWLEPVYLCLSSWGWASDRFSFWKCSGSPSLLAWCSFVSLPEMVTLLCHPSTGCMEFYCSLKALLKCHFCSEVCCNHLSEKCSLLSLESTYCPHAATISISYLTNVCQAPTMY